jgi:hypothetical protein
MSFADLQSLCWTGVLNGPTSEIIEYRRVADSGTGPWLQIRAMVHQVDQGNPRDGFLKVGVMGRTGEFPIFVTVKKSSVPNLRPKRDQVRWGGLEYEVKEVLTDDGVSLELYCGR